MIEEQVKHNSQEEWLTLSEIMRVLSEKYNIEMSEAAFRKYVQLDLLPRSKRIGKKGKHKGSSGIYPARVIDRIVLIRELMQGELTLEEIRDRFIFILNKIDTLDDEISSLIDHISEHSGQMELTEEEKLELKSLQDEIEKGASAFLDKCKLATKLFYNKISEKREEE